MSRSRAMKKQRRRAREAAGAPTAEERAAARARARGETGEKTGLQRTKHRPVATAEPAPRRPSRLDVRDGVPRPDAIWAPFPLTEIGMALGIVLFALGFASGAAGLFLAGIGVLIVVVGELCLREHFSGFRSHSLLLGLLPVTAVHLAVVYAGDVTWRGALPLALDLAVAGALAWWLQRRFAAAQTTARRAR